MLCDSNILIYAADPEDIVCVLTYAAPMPSSPASHASLVTRNVDDFKHIPNLKVINPFTTP